MDGRLDHVKVVFNLFNPDVEYTLGYINLQNINTVQELFNTIYDLPTMSELYTGYIFLLDFDLTVNMFPFTNEDYLPIFKNAFNDDENFIYVRTIYEHLRSNPRLRNLEYLNKWVDSDNKVRDAILFSKLKYGKIL